MERYRKTATVEAVQITEENRNEIMGLINSWNVRVNPMTRRMESVTIDTLEGAMHALPGYWVMRGVQGELYFCRDDIFQATYEKVEEKE